VHVLAKLFAPEINQPRSMDASPRSSVTTMERDGFFYFFIFQFRFLQKYIFVFEIYRNIPRPPRCRAAGAFLRNLSQKICTRVPGGPVVRQRGGRPPGRPAVGRLDLAARLRGDHLPFPSKRVAFKNSRKKYSVRRNTIYTPYHGLTVH